MLSTDTLSHPFENVNKVPKYSSSNNDPYL